MLMENTARQETVSGDCSKRLQQRDSRNKRRWQETVASTSRPHDAHATVAQQQAQKAVCTTANTRCRCTTANTPDCVCAWWLHRCLCKQTTHGPHQDVHKSKHNRMRTLVQTPMSVQTTLTHCTTANTQLSARSCKHPCRCDRAPRPEN